MSFNGDLAVIRNGRSTSQISIYNYPEHLNPFFEDDNHKRLRFWKINKKGNSKGTRSSFSIENLRDIWPLKPFSLKKKSSTLGINKTSESPPVLRRTLNESYVHNGFLTAPDRRERYSGSAQPSPSLSNDQSRHHRGSLQHIGMQNSLDSRSIGFNRNDQYRSTLDAGAVGFNRNDQYRSTTQFAGHSSPNTRQSIRSSQTSLASTNPFESDYDSETKENPNVTVGRKGYRKKKKAPLPPHKLTMGYNKPEQANGIEADTSHSIDIKTLTSEIEQFVNITSEESFNNGIPHSDASKIKTKIQPVELKPMDKSSQDTFLHIEEDISPSCAIKATPQISPPNDLEIESTSKTNNGNLNVLNNNIHIHTAEMKKKNNSSHDTTLIIEENQSPNIAHKANPNNTPVTSYRVVEGSTVETLKEQPRPARRNRNVNFTSSEIITPKAGSLENRNVNFTSSEISTPKAEPLENRIVHVTSSEITTPKAEPLENRIANISSSEITTPKAESLENTDPEIGRVECIQVRCGSEERNSNTVIHKNLQTFQQKATNSDTNRTYYTLSQPPLSTYEVIEDSSTHIDIGQKPHILKTQDDCESEVRQSQSLEIVEPIVKAQNLMPIARFRDTMPAALERNDNSVNPTEENKQAVKRKSVKDIIDSINRSQRLLNESAAKGTKVYSTSLYVENNVEQPNELNRSKITSTTTPTSQLNNIPSVASGTEECSMKPDNNFKKSKINKTVCQYRESSPTASNLDWNPVPKPKRTINGSSM